MLTFTFSKSFEGDFFELMGWIWLGISVVVSIIGIWYWIRTNKMTAEKFSDDPIKAAVNLFDEINLRRSAAQGWCSVIFGSVVLLFLLAAFSSTDLFSKVVAAVIGTVPVLIGVALIVDVRNIRHKKSKGI